MSKIREIGKKYAFWGENGCIIRFGSMMKTTHELHIPNLGRNSAGGLVETHRAKAEKAEIN